MQEGTGSGDITHKVGGRGMGEWEYSVHIHTVVDIYSVSTIRVDGWMDGHCN